MPRSTFSPVQLMEEAFRKYADRPAYSFMGKVGILPMKL